MDRDQVLKKFKDSDWEKLIPRLCARARKIVSIYNWHTTSGSLPMGQGLEDLVNSAIEKTLLGIVTGETGKGIRVWKPENCDLLKFLTGVIESDVHSLVNLDDHKFTDRFAEKREESPADLFDSAVFKASLLSTGRETAEARYDQLMASLMKEVDGDPVLEELILITDELARKGELVTAKAVEKAGSLSKEQVRNGRRKLKNLVSKIRTGGMK